MTVETTKEEAKYQSQKGTIERNYGDGTKGEGVKKFNKAEAKAFFGMDKENYERLEGEQKDANVKKELDTFDPKKLKETYTLIKQVIEEYCELKPEYYTILPLWIIGTYMHDEFNTYPFLFINAMRGSGKSRLLKLISNLSMNGQLVADLREAVLFRTAKGSTICIDEFESVGGKEKSTLRELLNAAYKKGTLVKRMRKVSGKEGEKHEVETFDLYTSIAMANIWGMDEVLEDRCLSLILEKSNHPIKTRLIEDFDTNNTIKSIKEQFTRDQCRLCHVVTLKNTPKGWNSYLQNTNNTTTHTTHTTQNNTTTPYILYEKIYNTGIDGRNIELFYPLFIIANMIGEDVLEEVLKIAIEMVKVKKGDQLIESRDVMLIDFISRMHPTIEYKPIIDLTRDFKEFVGEIEDDDRWANSKWMGKALKRLNLILQKKRVARGSQVMLDIAKAKEKIKLFKVAEDEDEK